MSQGQAQTSQRTTNGAIAVTYGWSDLDLGHGFHETKQRVRYTISESARRIALDRLLALNHQCYEEEVKAGLHDRGAKRGNGNKGRGESPPHETQPPKEDFFK